MPPAIGKTIGRNVEDAHHQGSRAYQPGKGCGPRGDGFNLIAPFFRERRHGQGRNLAPILNQPRQGKGQIATLQGQRLAFTNGPKSGWA